MFFISPGVANRIRSLGRRDDVQRELAAIRAMPSFEVYANAIAEGVGHAHKPADPAHAPRHRDEASHQPRD